MNGILITLITLLITTIAQAQVTGTRVMTISFEGADRRVIIHVPSSYETTPTRPMPLLFGFHGGGGNAGAFFSHHRFEAESERNGFLTVVPDGLPHFLDPKPGEFFWGEPVNIAFVDHLITQMSSMYPVDLERVYLVGFSGGAKLIYEIAADPVVSQRITAVGTVAGEIGTSDTAEGPFAVIDPNVTGGKPLPAFLVQGALDPKLPIDGGYSKIKDAYVISFEEKVNIFTELVDVETLSPVDVRYRQAPPRVASKRWTNPSTRNSVVALVDPNLAHAWPEWNLLGAMIDFFKTVPPTRSRGVRP